MRARRLLPVLIIASAALWLGCNKSSEQAATAPAPGEEAKPPAAAAPAPEAATPNRPAAKRPSAAENAKGAAKQGTEAAGAPAAPAAAPAPAEPPKPQPKTYTVAAGTPIRVRTTSAISTKTAESGSSFVATLESPLMSGDEVIAPKGATVDGKVTESDSGGRVKGRAQISVQLVTLHLENGTALALSTDPVAREAEGTKKKDAAKVGIGAGVGAAIGAIAGGGRGAAIGAAAGGGAGTAAVLATKGAAAVIPAETVLSFKLLAPISVTR